VSEPPDGAVRSLPRETVPEQVVGRGEIHP
jgi:hypothetical protein